MPEIGPLRWRTEAERLKQLRGIENEERARAKIADEKGDKVGEAVHTYIAETVNIEVQHVETIRDAYRGTSKSVIGTPVLGDIAFKVLPTNAPAGEEVRETAVQAFRDIQAEQTVESENRMASLDGETKSPVASLAAATAEPSGDLKKAPS